MNLIRSLSILAIVIGLMIQAPAAWAGTNLESIRAAVAAEPDRPGLRVALAAHLILGGELDEAEEVLNIIIKRWPKSTRPKALLAAIQKLRNDKKPTSASVNAAKKIKNDSQSPQSTALTWRLRGNAGLHHDSIAGWETTAASNDVLPKSAWRSQLGADAQANYVAEQWRYQGGVGVDRTLHLETQSFAADRDRSLLSLHGRAEHSTESHHRLGFRADLKGALGGRPGTPHHFAGGVGGWWSFGQKYLSPFVEARGWHFEFAPSGSASFMNRVLRLGEGAIGVASQLQRFRLSTRFNALWLEPNKRSGYTEFGGDFGVDFVYQPVVVRLRGGVGYRAPGDAALADSIRPRGLLQLRARINEHLFVLLESHWRRTTNIYAYLPGDNLDRWVSGIQVEVIQ